MLRKKEVFTIITPIPGFIPRQLAIDILHSHSEVITLNPLVLDHKPIPAPRDAASDEFYSTWYEITERIQYIPGIGRMGSGKISFNGCFHDMPWGLQTHIYAPMNVDLRNKYRIAGNQPGVEPPETPEIGLAELGAPKDGLYLREDIEIKCNVAVVGFVKAELKKASREMVQRIIKKAELLDAGVLQGMIEDGKLRTINPADRSNTVRSSTGSRASPQHSPTAAQYPGNVSAGGVSPSVPYNVPRPMSVQYARPGSSSQASVGGYSTHGAVAPQELAGPHSHPGRLGGPGGGGQAVIMELPGDYYHPQSSPRSAPPAGGSASQTSNSPRGSLSATPPPGGYPGDARVSGVSYTSGGAGGVSRPSSLQSESSAPGGGMRSPPADRQGFASDLATHSETAEEHHRDEALKRLGGAGALRPLPDQQQQSPQQQQQGYSYNPADYAKVSPQLQQTQQMQQLPQQLPYGNKYAAAYGHGPYGQQQHQQGNSPTYNYTQ